MEALVLAALFLATPPTLVEPRAVLAEGSTTPRPLEARFADEVNVRDFGAMADGSDDAPRIQAALDHAVATGKRAVYIPAGNYSLGASLNLQGVWGLRIRGAGVGWYNITRLASRHGGKPVFDAVGASSLAFQDLLVAGAPGAEAPSCAFLFSRGSANSGAGMHELRHVWTTGYFSKAAVVSLSSEVNKYDGCVLANAHPDAHAFWTATGNAGVGMTSDFSAPPDVQDGGDTMFEFVGGIL